MRMDEKRKFKRIIVEGMDVHCKMLFSTNVNLLTVSLGGASISLQKRLHMGSEYTLKIECKDKIFSIKGIVVWEKLADYAKDEHGEMVPIYTAGIKFKDILTGKGDELIDFIDENTAPEPTKLRLRGTRVRIAEPEKTTILDFYKSFNVKKLSLGGMLVESDHDLDAESKFLMELIFPEDKGSVKFRGRIASCLELPDKLPKCYDTGIEFVEMSKEDRSTLKEFIDFLETP